MIILTDKRQKMTSGCDYINYEINHNEISYRKSITGGSVGILLPIILDKSVLSKLQPLMLHFALHGTGNKKAAYLGDKPLDNPDYDDIISSTQFFIDLTINYSMEQASLCVKIKPSVGRTQKYYIASILSKNEMLDIVARYVKAWKQIPDIWKKYAEKNKIGSSLDYYIENRIEIFQPYDEQERSRFLDELQGLKRRFTDKLQKCDDVDDKQRIDDDLTHLLKEIIRLQAQPA